MGGIRDTHGFGWDETGREVRACGRSGRHRPGHRSRRPGTSGAWGNPELRPASPVAVLRPLTSPKRCGATSSRQSLVVPAGRCHERQPGQDARAAGCAGVCSRTQTSAAATTAESGAKRRQSGSAEDRGTRLDDDALQPADDSTRTRRRFLSPGSLGVPGLDSCACFTGSHRGVSMHRGRGGAWPEVACSRSWTIATKRMTRRIDVS